MNAPVQKSRQHRLNTIISYVLLGVLLLSPLPLGSNRPVFWGLETALIGLIGLVYFIAQMRGGHQLRFELNRVRAVVILFGVFCLWGLVQVLPVFGGLFPVQGLRGAGIDMPSLSLTPYASMLGWLRMLGLGLFFLLMLQVGANDQRARQMGLLIYIGIIAYAVFGIFQQLGGMLLFYEKWAYIDSATGTFVNRNSFATFLSMGLVLGIALGLERLYAQPDPKNRNLSYLDNTTLEGVLILLGALVIFATLIMTNSRMGVFAGVVGGGVTMTLMMLSRGGMNWGRILMVLAGGAVIGGVALIGFGETLLVRLGSVEDNSDVRFTLYGQIWDMIMARPLLGYGLDSFALTYPLFHGPEVSPDLVWDRAHSTYLAHWVESGLVFGSLPLVIIALLLAGLVRSLLDKKRDTARVVAAIGVILVGAVHSTVDFSLEMQANVLMFLALIALGTTRGRSSKRTRRRAEPTAGAE